jgi:hypothetical protein
VNDCKDNEHGNAHAATIWMQQLPPWAKAMVAFMFMFTIWSVFTGFDLGNLMNKIADAELEQRKMQFEAQLRMQEMQFEVTQESNVKLDQMIEALDEVVTRLDAQGEKIFTIIERLARVEEQQVISMNTQGLLIEWVCAHEKDEDSYPTYCQ